MLERGLVGYWSPWLGATGFRLFDRTRYANHGALTNMGPPTAWVGANILGRSGRVLDFLGSSNQYVDIPRPFPQRNNWSFLIWYKCASAASSTQSPLSMGTSLSVANFFLAPNRNGTIQTYQSDVYRSTGIAANTNWNCAVISRLSASVGYLAINGVRFSANPTNTATDTMTIRIGSPSFGVGGVAAFTGQIAEVAAWTRVLTNSEEQTLYRIGPGWFGQREPRRRYAIEQAGFRAYWARRQPQIIGGGL